MYFLNLDILVLQLFPVHWRRVKGKVAFLKVILRPFKQLLNDFNFFRKSQKTNINLSAQVIVIENYIEMILKIRYGVFIRETTPGRFLLNVPEVGRIKEKQIKQFLNKILPLGRSYQIVYY